MMTNYIYQVGGSLSKNSPTYVTRQADIELYQALKKREFCYILNCRQMGKSSLLVRTYHRLQQQGFKCTTIDMTNIGSENITPLQWYKGIVTDLWRGFKLTRKYQLKKWWQELGDISLPQKLSQFICDILLVEYPTENICIFIDEIDSILSLDFAVDDFFALIRYCYNQRTINPEYNRITFAIFGVATPSDLIQDRKRTPFNIGKAIELHGFTLEEVAPLAIGLKVKQGNAETVLKEILAWTGGQPLLTQKLCDLVVKVSQNAATGIVTIPQGNESFWVESIVRTKILHNWKYQDEPEHLKTIQNRIEYYEDRAGRLLGIYQEILEDKEVKVDDSREKIELILSGLIIKISGLLKVKNRIYQEVFNLEWVAKKLSNLRPYAQIFDAWIASKQNDESRLLRGQALKDAQRWSHGKSLSDLDYQFLAASVELDRKESQKALEAERIKEVEARLKQEQKTAKLQRLLLGVITTAFTLTVGLGITIFLQYRQVANQEIQVIVKYSETLFATNQKLDAFVEAIKAKKRLQKFSIANKKLANQIEMAIRKAVYQLVEYNRLSGHEAGLTGVDISANGEMIATSSFDDTIKLWRRDGTLLKTLEHEDSVLTVIISPNGKFIASGSDDRTVKVWKTDGSLLTTFKKHNDVVRGLAFSPDGDIIVSGSADNTIKLWQPDGTLLTTIKGHSAPVWVVAFSPDGNIIASGSADNTIKLWQPDGTLLTTIKGHTQGVWGLAFSPDGKLLATSGFDNTVKIWNIQSKKVKLLHSLNGHQAEIWGVAFSPDGKTIASASGDKTIKIWHINGTLLKTLRDPNEEVYGVAFSPDGKTLISASGDKTAKLWKLKDSLLTTLSGHTDSINEVAISPLGDQIVTVSTDKTIKLWEQHSGEWQLARSIPYPKVVMTVAFSPDGKMFATGGMTPTVTLWKIDGTLVRTFQDHQESVFAVAFSPDGKFIASGSKDNTIKIWQVEGGLHKTLEGHQHSVEGVSFSPDSKLLVSASRDKTLKLWNIDGMLLRTFKGHNAAASNVTFSPDGTAIASVSHDETVMLWELDENCVQTWRCLSQVKSELHRSLTLEGHQGEVWGVVFSPDGKMLATAGCDQTVKLWKRDGTLISSLYGHKDDLSDLAFSPDGKAFASSSKDGTVILWDLEKVVDIEQLVVNGCDLLGDYLRTNAEVESSERSVCDGL